MPWSPRGLSSQLVNLRQKDGYINATALCKASGKLFADYARLDVTAAFMQELSRSTGIPVDLLVVTIKNGSNSERGTWIHPDIAVNLAQWCSARFAVMVSRWGPREDERPQYR